MPISQITGASIQDGSIVVADLGITTFNTGTGNTLTLQANSATGLVIDVTGNTAIANTLSFTGTGARIRGDMNNATLANRVMFQTSTANSNSILSVIPNGTATTTAFQAFNNSDPTNASQADLRVAGSTDVRLSSTTAGSGTALPLTMYTGGSERLRIDTSGNMMLGVTTASSSTKFDVYGNSSAAHIGARVTNAATDGYSTLWLSSSNDGLVRGGSTAGAFTSELAMLTSGSIPLTFYTANTKRMTIGATGNIGIGTTSPSQLLHVAAGTILASNTSGTIATVSIAGNGSTTGTSDFSLLQGTSSEAYVFNRANSFLVLGTNNTERMRITSTGKVGIGITPAAWETNTNSTVLQVYSSSFFDYLGAQLDVGLNTYYDGSNYRRITTAAASRVSQSDGAHWWSTTASGSAGSTLSWTETMRITAAGNVGIGTSSPNGILQAGVTGNSLIFNNSSFSELAPPTTGNDLYIFRSQNDGSFNFSSRPGGGGNYRFWVGSTQVMRIDSSGRVGIGATTPASRFHVRQNTGGTDSDNDCVGQFILGDSSTYGSILFVKNAGNRGTRANPDGSGLLTLAFSNATALNVDKSGNLAFDSGYGSAATAYGCRAWVNFDGTGANGAKTIRASGGVSSIVKTATGIYTMNFATAMPDTNYCPLAWDLNYGAGWYDSPFSVGSFQFRRVNNSWTPTDTGIITVAVFR